MKIKKLGALLVSAALCAGMAAPAFAFEGEAAPVEQPVLSEVVEEDVVTITDETSGALTPEGNLTLVDDYHANYSDGSGQQFITLVSKSGATFYLVIDRNAKGQQTVHFMNLVDEADLLAHVHTRIHIHSYIHIVAFLIGFGRAIIQTVGNASAKQSCQNTAEQKSFFQCSHISPLSPVPLPAQFSVSSRPHSPSVQDWKALPPCRA